MIVVTVITEYVNQYVIELLKNTYFLCFMLGYIIGVLTILFIIKTNDDKNFTKIVGILKSFFLYHQQSTIEVSTAAPTSRPPTPPKKRTQESIDAGKKTAAKHLWNEKIVAYFDVFLEIISRTKTIKLLKDDIQMAKNKKQNLKEEVEKLKKVSLD